MTMVRANRINQTREQWAQIKLDDKEMEVVTKLADLVEHRPLPSSSNEVCCAYFLSLTLSEGFLPSICKTRSG